MKRFIYGRPAVEMGDRGYRVFKADGFDTDDLKALKSLFSDHDPDSRTLKSFDFRPFYVYIPWRSQQWIFGKGIIEARGKLGAMYYSYLFHGVVLSEKDRDALGHNPFVLADFWIWKGRTGPCFLRFPKPSTPWADSSIFEKKPVS